MSILKETLDKYSVITLYEEIRDEKGILVANKSFIYDQISLDDELGYIMLKDKANSGICMLRLDLACTTIPWKYGEDKIIISTNIDNIVLFGKKI